MYCLSPASTQSYNKKKYFKGIFPCFWTKILELFRFGIVWLYTSFDSTLRSLCNSHYNQ